MIKSHLTYYTRPFVTPFLLQILKIQAIASGLEGTHKSVWRVSSIHQLELINPVLHHAALTTFYARGNPALLYRSRSRMHPNDFCGRCDKVHV
jgi:hypothetical protein